MNQIFALAITVAALLSYSSPALADIPVCTGSDRAERRLTCVVDGDTGWEDGVKWRLAEIDTPEISRPECKREQRLGFKARDRLLELMSDGYTMERLKRQDRFDRDLVRIRLANGQDAGSKLVREGLAQPWPNKGNRWCGRR